MERSAARFSWRQRDLKAMLRKLIAGSDRRKTRLHDELGRRVSLGKLVRNGPSAIATGIGRVAFGRRPERPWISYDAQKIIAAFLDDTKSVLEFGSGMSTLWYARHAGRVVSVEVHEGWYDQVAERLRAQANVDYRLATERAAYVDPLPGEAFDLTMIDGSWRPDCARTALATMKPGAMIYLDNADMEPGSLSGDVPEARRLLLDHARKKGLPVREFTDFAPTQFHVQGGLMIGGPAV